ncbi:MAG: carboxypeptidase-like regulatory domain-containing protein, partial [Bacteroidota bacterium]
MRSIRVLGLLVLAPFFAFAQERASVSGYVTDARTGETLLLANVRIAGTTTGAATNNSGYYTLTGLAPGSYDLIYSYLGYLEAKREVT